MTVGQQTMVNALSVVNLGAMGSFTSSSINVNSPQNVDVRQSNDIVFEGSNSSRRFHIVTDGNLGMADAASLTAEFASTFNALGTIRLADSASTSVALADTFLFAGTGIVVGGFSNATMNRVQFVSAGDVEIHQVGFLAMMGPCSAANLLLESTMNIRDAANLTLDVTGDAIFRAVGASLADDETNVYRICGNTFFDVSSFVLVDEPGSVTMTSHSVKDLAFASIAIDSTVC
jgi:hypothetical protein